MINTVRQLLWHVEAARTKIFRTTDEADTAHVVSELPTARKP